MANFINPNNSPTTIATEGKFSRARFSNHCLFLLPPGQEQTPNACTAKQHRNTDRVQAGVMYCFEASSGSNLRCLFVLFAPCWYLDGLVMGDSESIANHMWCYKGLLGCVNKLGPVNY